MRKEYIFTALGTALGLVVGGVAGYRYAEMKLEEKYEQIASEEIVKAKNYYRSTIRKDVFESPMQMVEAVAKLDPEASDALVKYGSVDSDDEAPSNVVNIFDVSGDESLLDPERRDPEEPYIITEEEYLEGEPEFEQVTLTYYEGDNVLTDDRDQIVPDHSCVGDDNLVHFGLGTEQKNMLFIRNEKAEADYEVSRSEGSYSVEVLGFDPEDLEEKQPLRMRMRDDG